MLVCPLDPAATPVFEYAFVANPGSVDTSNVYVAGAVCVSTALPTTRVTASSTLRMDAPAAGGPAGGTLTGAVDAASGATDAAAVGCVGVLFFEHAAAARHTAAP